MGMFDKLFGKKKQKGLTKSCPYCGQLLDNAAFKCTRCNKWMDNEVFHRLCDDDVKLIKNKDLIPVTPTLIAAMVIYHLKESDPLEKEMQELGKKKLTEEQRFNLLVFRSFCGFMGICSSPKMKRGCRDTITKELEVALLRWVAELFTDRVKHAPSLEVLIQRGAVLYAKLGAAWDKIPWEASPSSQMEAGNAFATAIFADNEPVLIKGLGLFTYFLEMLTPTRDAFSKMFLVEEADFDWQSLCQPGVPKAFI